MKYRVSLKGPEGISDLEVEATSPWTALDRALGTCGPDDVVVGIWQARPEHNTAPAVSAAGRRGEGNVLRIY